MVAGTRTICGYSSGHELIWPELMSSLTTTQKLLVCGAIAGPLFVLVFLVEGATRADYSALRHPVSSLAIGELGWMQTVNFLVTGPLVLAFAIGLRRALRPALWGPLLVGLTGIGLIGAGVFTTDPINGYPPGTPFMPARTVRGLLHVLFSAPVFLAWPIACFVFARLFFKLHKREWASFLMLSGVAIVAATILTGLGINQVSPGLAALAGAFQRMSIIMSFLWTGLLAVHLLRSPSEVCSGSGGAMRVTALFIFVVLTAVAAPRAQDFIPPAYLSPKYVAPQRSRRVLSVAGKDEPGERMIVTGQATAGGKPVAGVSVYVFHADAAGLYSRDGAIATRTRGCTARCASTRTGAIAMRRSALPVTATTPRICTTW